jgi:hypothetical protein
MCVSCCCLQEGTIQLLDVGACSVVHTEQAHSGAVWSLALLPDKSGFVTGSAGEVRGLAQLGRYPRPVYIRVFKTPGDLADMPVCVCGQLQGMRLASTHHHYTFFQPGSLRIEQQIYLGARQASHHQAVYDHYSPSKPGPVTALKANSTRIGYHK